MKKSNGMIIVKIHGGLGNQMFQYALGRNLSFLHGAPFKIDSSYLQQVNQSGRSFQLDKFNTVLNEATTQEIRAYRSTFQKILDCLRPESRKKKVLERSEFFDESVLKRSDGYFDGYWQNEKYFAENEKEIRGDFTLKNPMGPVAAEMASQIAAKPNAISVHIRRGDYVTIQKVAETLGTLPISYYQNAAKIILEKFPNAHFFIFSDDIEWTKENFPKNLSATLVSRPEMADFEEMILISLCKHNIIANSTFSWWGAWLNQNPEKMVIAPKKWRADGKSNDSQKTPNRWTQI